LVASGRDIPQVIILSPQDNISVSAGEKITVSGTAISKRYQIKEIGLRISGAYSDSRKIQLNPAQATATFNFDVNLPSSLKAGDQVLIYVDAIDNSSSETRGSAGPVRINIISPKPVVQILSPSNDDIFYPLSSLNTTVFAQSSNLSVKSVSYHIEGSGGKIAEETYTPQVPQKSLTKSFTYKIPEDIEEQDLFISATALDTSDSEGKSETLRIRIVDNVKPIVSVISPANNSFVDAGSSVELVVKAEDKNSLIAEINANVISPYTDAKKLLINKKSDEVTFTFQIPDTLVSNQVITIQVFALDDSSLSNKSEVIQWRLRVR
ncbi:MAG: Ig-like domain-containing protein, partial [Deltaproteobacteria bacterium]|nr:Ig-like domain-containing protein [Deltaproteobacteria bacterium]